VALLRELVNDISDGEARLTLYLIDVLERIVYDPEEGEQYTSSMLYP